MANLFAAPGRPGLLPHCQQEATQTSRFPRECALPNRRLAPTLFAHTAIARGAADDGSMNPVFFLIYQALNLYIFIVLGAVIFQLLAQFGVINTRQPLVSAIGEFLWRATEPVLAPIRRRLPNLGPIDISPVVLILIVSALQYTLVWLSRQLGI
jgi:YggT family protein